MGLFIEILLVGSKFTFLQHTALPPCLQESESVAKELNESSLDGKETYHQRFVFDRRIDEDEEHVYENRNER